MKHWSDCAVHNGPAYPPGPCNCSGIAGSFRRLWGRVQRWIPIIFVALMLPLLTTCADRLGLYG